MSHKPHPLKRLQTAWPGSREKVCEIFLALKTGSACGPSTAFVTISHTIFHNVFHVLSMHFFTIFFRTFFAFSFTVSLAFFFRTSDFAHFAYHIFQRCAAKSFP